MDSKVFRDLENANKKLESNFGNYSKCISQRSKKWEGYEKQYTEFQKQVPMLHLNVGGHSCIIGEEALYSIPNSNFKKIIAESKKFREDSKEVFIDRPRKHFEIILNYIRKRKVNPENYTIDQKLEIIEEANFYGVKLTFLPLLPLVN